MSYRCEFCSKRCKLESGLIQHLNGTVCGEKDLQKRYTILSIIMSDLPRVQETGVQWDLHYRGTIHKSITFVPYFHFIKCDTVEADKLAGKYSSRAKGVATLCCYCCCPTNESDCQ